MKKKPESPKPAIPLLSRQWRSESTRAAAAQPANGSGSPTADGSPTGGPPPPCEGAGWPPKSVAFNEKPTLVAPVPEFSGGRTYFYISPTFSYGAFCDGEQKIWTCRVTSAVAQQAQIIGGYYFPVTNATINAADCFMLRGMHRDVTANIYATGITGYCPVGFIEVHENVHRDLASESIQKHYPKLVADIEGISFACSSYANAAAAYAAMQPAIRTAEKRFRENFYLDELTNSEHVPLQRFIDAQAAFCFPWLDKIIEAMVIKGCVHR